LQAAFFQVSLIPSRIYIKPSQLEALKVLLFKELQEPIGKNAHIHQVERYIRSLRDSQRILEIEEYKTKLISRYNSTEKEIWEEISEMNNYGKKR